MQSFLQYRRFHNRLRGQIERHGLDQIAGQPSSQPGHPITDAPDAAVEAKDIEDSPVTLSAVTQEQTGIVEKDQMDGADGQGSSSDGSASSVVSVESRLRETTTQSSMGTRLGNTLTGVNVRSRSTNEGGHSQGKVFVVGYAGEDDPLNPHNWSVARKVVITILVAWIGFIVGFASSVDSAALPQAMEEFGVSEVVESLATGLYLVGFGCGAFFAAPISETIGRNPVYITTLLLFSVFVMASALAPNIGAQLVFRFLAGFFGATPLTNAGGSISDLWSAEERSIAFPVFANAGFTGPIMGPVVGGFIGQSSIISWRWTEWITLIWSGLILVALILFLPETYAPILLKWKAAHLREITGDTRYVSELEVRQTTLADRLKNNIYRPFLLFVFEPIVVLLTLYLTVIYIVLFTFLTGYGFIFTQVFKMSQGDTFLSFLGLGIGFAGASALVPWIYKRYKRQLEDIKRNGGSRLPPEQRLVFAMVGSPAIPIGLLWMAWTSYASLGPWPALASTVVTGFGILCIFISTYQYLIDGYEAYAASALVGATFVRYVVAGAFIEISIPMYKNLGVHWTLTILGCISLLMTPVPFIFYRYGHVIRKRSRFASEFVA